MRTFDVIYGIDGADQSVALADVPMWDARRGAMTILRGEAERCDSDGHGEMATNFRGMRESFMLAGCGPLLDGYLLTYDGLDGKRRFIGVVEHGVNYREARATDIRFTAPATEDFATIVADKMAKAAHAAVTR